MRRLALTTVLGTAASVAATFTLTAPAYAAGEPTITTTISERVKNGIAWGTQDVVISGTAPAGSLVRLREAAYVYRPAITWADNFNGGTVTTTAGSDGRYSFTRYLDAGHVFQVQVGDDTSARSEIIEVPIIAYPIVNTIASTAANTVNVDLEVSPAQDFLGLEVERAVGNDWVVVASGNVDIQGKFIRTITGEPGGAQRYRVWADGDANNLLTGSYSEHVFGITVQGTGPGTNPTTTPSPRPSTPTTPAKPTTPKPTPAKPTTPTPTPVKPTTPTTPKPTPPPVVAPGVGSVRFTKIQFDAPGRDTSSNLNDEWLRLTNTSRAAVNLRNWSVREAGGRVYRFGNTYVLAPGAVVWIRTGKGTNSNPRGHLYWNSGSHLWNNSGDTATLRNGSNTVIDTCTWTRDTDVTYC